MAEGAPTEINERNLGQEEHVERAKACGVIVRDFAYEMRPHVPFISPASPDDAQHAISPSQDDSSRYEAKWPLVRPGPMLVQLGSIYTTFRILRAYVHRSDLGNSVIPFMTREGGEILRRFELIALIKFGWVKVAEIDWALARQHLGNALLSYAQYPIDIIASDTRIGQRKREHDIEKNILSYRKNGDIPWDEEEDRQHLDQYGPFGSGLSHLVSKETQEILYREIVRVDK